MEADERIVRQCSTFTPWCVPRRQLFRRIPDETSDAIDRTGSSSLRSGSGRFMLRLPREIPRSARETSTSTLLCIILRFFFRLNPFTDRVRDPTGFCMDERRQFRADITPPPRCIAAYHLEVLLPVFFLSSSDIFITLRYVFIPSLDQLI